MSTKATDWDHRIIDGVSVALEGKIGESDDVERLMSQVKDGPSEAKLGVACEIAVAFIRYAQDLKAELKAIAYAQEQADRIERREQS